MPTIIISYRRNDSKWIAGRIFDWLEQHYGKGHVFMDIDSIPFGLDFRSYLEDTLDRCDILLAIVGPQWSDRDEAGKPRILDETDWVRIEIETSLRMNIPVIPVLIDDTRMPKLVDLPDSLRDFAFRQAAQIDSGRDFRAHIERLVRSMDTLLALKQEAQPIAEKTSPAPPVSPQITRDIHQRVSQVPPRSTETSRDSVQAPNTPDPTPPRTPRTAARAENAQPSDPLPEQRLRQSKIMSGIGGVLLCGLAFLTGMGSSGFGLVSAVALVGGIVALAFAATLFNQDADKTGA